MGKRTNQRRLRKAKEREKRNRKNRKVLTERRRQRESERRVRRHSPLPEFEIRMSEATDDIKELVEVGIKNFDKCYPRLLDNDILALMSKHVRGGWTDLINSLAADVETMTREQIERALYYELEMDLGNGIILNVPDNLIRRTLPMSCFILQPSERGWVVQCRSLKSRRVKQGVIYQSPYRPTISRGGVDLEVVFTRHAMVQLVDRLIPKWGRYYLGHIYVFGFMYECVYFEVEKLLNKQPALVIYNSCLRTGRTFRDYMQKLLKVDTADELANYYYRVGYCPITTTDRLAIAKTFLTPGYWQTPERRTLPKNGGATLLADIEQACDDGINTSSVATCEKTRAAIKWFHEHGVPQVKRIDAEVFRHIDGPFDLRRVHDGGEDEDED